jgi:hypothetical protein
MIHHLYRPTAWQQASKYSRACPSPNTEQAHADGEESEENTTIQKHSQKCAIDLVRLEEDDSAIHRFAQFGVPNRDQENTEHLNLSDASVANLTT